MKDNDPPTLITIPSSTAIRKDASSSSSSSKTRVFLNKNGYKFWVLAAILLLAFWSMFTSSVTLKWSAGNLSRLSDDLDIPTFDDLDILEVEEREKVVRHMWDLYTQTTSTCASILKLPPISTKSFWIPKSACGCDRELNEGTSSFDSSDGADGDEGCIPGSHALLAS